MRKQRPDLFDAAVCRGVGQVVFACLKRPRNLITKRLGHDRSSCGEVFCNLPSGRLVQTGGGDADLGMLHAMQIDPFPGGVFGKNQVRTLRLRKRAVLNASDKLLRKCGAQLSYEQHPHFVDFAPLADELRIRLNNWFCRVPEASDKKNPGAGRNVRHLCFIVGDVAGHPFDAFFQKSDFRSGTNQRGAGTEHVIVEAQRMNFF